MFSNKSPLFYRWVFQQNQEETDIELIKKLSKDLDISITLAKILWKRGLRSKDEIFLFLNPGLRNLKPLSSVPNLEKAANFVAIGLKQGKKIAIWGDYDVDGITSTTILVDFLRKKGFSPIYYIPDRFEEGYGLNINGLKKLKNEGIELLITVDLGISNIEEVRWLKENGIAVVITDHHIPGDVLPDADFIINPKIGSDAYYNLAGVGVAFLFMAALNNQFQPKIDVRTYLDLVAIGTIADVVPMDLYNRILVKNGLLVLNESRRPGIVALKNVSGLNHSSKLGTYEIGYILGPRLNASGRMAKGDIGVELLLCEDLERANKLAKELDDYNKLRKQKEDKILKEALSQIDEKDVLPGYVLYKEDWHEGIIGIVASKICEKTYRPTILLTGKNGIIKGSGRSIPQVDLYSVLKKCSLYLKKFGGHKQAAGMALDSDNLVDFERAFLNAVEDVVGGKKLIPELFLDLHISFDEVNFSLVKELDMLEPFGPENPEPIFCANSVLVQKYKTVGKEHVFLELRDEKSKRTFWGKAWNMIDFIPQDIEGKYVDIAFYPKVSTYNGLIGIDLLIKDLTIY